MTYLISVDRLKKREKENTVIVDVRFDLQDAQAGKAYIQAHIPGAVYLDLNQDLSSKKQKHGGSHPLPDMELLAAKLGNIGIGPDTTVVIYDADNDMFAPRLWWLLHHLGHEKAYVLDGGFKRWVDEGNPTTAEIPRSQPKTFRLNPKHSDTVDINQVKEKLAGNEAILIDSRAKDRYLGKTEPLYKKAGHIPGAKNYFWKNVLDDSGKWKTIEALQDHFKDLPKDKEIIVSCGSGVSACPNILALKTAGFSNVKLYPGSFSDWISYDDNPVAKGEA
ncbi:sulfurtransferase [Virgibacillus sp. 179-BFC.A HS]|uniref:Sulfurtransferase n=1 Tax=Tigheibacillus jepli TaxID=3035914 RepID=A0ABU5CMC4_9BACI|nr:sulfurtransferase [Virgibacillus sp. 179-BFC.A HS]MDY0406977.1 sulfurtransferase [Virgibacillus sp. 179-BFC.A HS]